MSKSIHTMPGMTRKKVPGLTFSKLSRSGSIPNWNGVLPVRKLFWIMMDALTLPALPADIPGQVADIPDKSDCIRSGCFLSYI
jgi:hypothetical protein